MEHFEELLPIVSNPTVRHACQRYGLMFKSMPRGLFITLEDRGRVFRILKNWPERNVRLIVITDGERVGALGDLGVQVGGVGGCGGGGGGAPGIWQQQQHERHKQQTGDVVHGT